MREGNYQRVVQEERSRACAQVQSQERRRLLAMIVGEELELYVGLSGEIEEVNCAKRAKGKEE